MNKLQFLCKFREDRCEGGCSLGQDSEMLEDLVVRLSQALTLFVCVVHVLQQQQMSVIVADPIAAAAFVHFFL
jgi:hypothetical protein